MISAWFSLSSSLAVTGPRYESNSFWSSLMPDMVSFLLSRAMSPNLKSLLSFCFILSRYLRLSLLDFLLVDMLRMLICISLIYSSLYSFFCFYLNVLNSLSSSQSNTTPCFRNLLAYGTLLIGVSRISWSHESSCASKGSTTYGSSMFLCV